MLTASPLSIRIEPRTTRIAGDWRLGDLTLVQRSRFLGFPDAISIQTESLGPDRSSVAIYSVRETARQLGERLGREPLFEGSESGTAFVSDTARLTALLGAPPTPLSDVLRWTAQWVKSGARSFNKPAHFEVCDGTY